MTKENALSQDESNLEGNSLPGRENQSSKASSRKEPDIGRTAFEAAEKIGYAATIAWLPSLLLSGSLADGDFAALCTALPEPVSALGAALPVCTCLVLCCVFGLVLMFAANHITSKSQFFRLWIAAIVCTTVALCVRSDIVEAIALSAAFTIARLLWKAHLVNKAFDSSTLLTATFLGGVVLLMSALIDKAAADFLLCILLLVSLCAFLSVSSTTYKDWIFVPKEAMRAKGLTLTQRVFPAAAKAMAGIAFGTIACTCSYETALVIAGIAWLGSAGTVSLSKRLKKHPSKSAVRGYFMIGSIATLIAIPVLPNPGNAAAAGVLTLLMVASALVNAIRHMVIEKDLTLSDVNLFGFRHATNAIGMIAGYLGSFMVFTFTPPPSAISFGFFGIAVILISLASLLSLGTFENKRERMPVSSIVDPWHEKVMLIAKQNNLTPRQTEIFDALSRGRNAKYITQRLYLSEGTVKKQVFQIYKRLDVHTQQDLITLVMNTDLDSSRQ